MQYEIFNNVICVKINTHGAELCSLKKQNDSIEYIWQGDEEYWNRHAPILFPIVGKLLDNEYTYKDKQYQMNQHGFARDCEFEMIDQTSNYICFRLESNHETLKIYPFDFELQVSYTLIENNVNVSYKVINKSSCKMYFSIGSHPAFNWPLNNEEKSDYYFEFQDTENLERLPLTINGISDKKNNITLQDNKFVLNEKLFENDAIILNTKKNKQIILKNTKNNRFIKILFDTPYLGLWSKIEGSPFICMEPWHGIADFISHNKNFVEKHAIETLKQNSIFDTSYIISI